MSFVATDSATTSPAVLERAMQRALDLARSVRGRTAPNPAVGAVVLREGMVVGEGASRPAGSDHAEVVALRSAGGAARGATLVVTLEPCNHSGRTPRCTDAIVDAGITRVVAAVRDANPAVSGGGLERLASRRVAVECADVARPAAELNYPFFKLVTYGRPFITAKWAMTLDGKIAEPSGGGAITAAPARRDAFLLRDTVDAVLIGSGTARVDDPRLTVRPPPPDGRQPVRVVLDSHASLEPGARLLAEPGRTIVVATDAAPADRVRRLADVGAEVRQVSAGDDGRVSIDAALELLAGAGFAHVLAEGGAHVLGALFAAGAVDRVVVYVAPRIMGDGLPAVVPPATGAAFADRLDLDALEVRRLGPDSSISGYLRRYDPPGL